MKEFEEIIKDLKNKIYRPIYLLMGEEPYYINQIADFIQKNLLTEAEKTFNQLVLYGKDTDAVTVTNAARRFPMMANYQVVIVKEAQEMKKIEELHYYAEKPLKSTILVLCNKYGKVAKNTKLYKAVALHGVILDTKKLYDNQVPDWIITTLKSKGYTIDAAAAALLTEFLGTDLGRIVHELDKLMIVLPPEIKIINAQHIEKNIGISKEYNNFELNKALGQRNILKANKIIDYFTKNPKASPMPVTIPVLFNFYSKLLLYHYLPDKSRATVAGELGINPFFVQEYELAAKKFTPIKVVNIIGLLREYDVKSKGVGSANVPDGELLRELVYKILH